MALWFRDDFCSALMTRSFRGCLVVGAGFGPRKNVDKHDRMTAECKLQFASFRLSIEFLSIPTHILKFKQHLFWCFITLGPRGLTQHLNPQHRSTNLGSNLLEEQTAMKCW